MPEGSRGATDQQGYPSPSPSSSSSSLASFDKDDSDTPQDHPFHHLPQPPPTPPPQPPQQDIRQKHHSTKEQQQERADVHKQCIPPPPPQQQQQQAQLPPLEQPPLHLSKIPTTSLVRDHRGGLFLPAELILCIFRFLTSPQDLRAAILVCKRWCNCGVDLLWSRPALTNLSITNRLIWTLMLPSGSRSIAAKDDDNNSNGDSSLSAAVAMSLTTTTKIATTFPYATYIRRLNLNFVTSEVTDTILMAFANCRRLERLIMPGCKKTTEEGLRTLLQACPGLYSLDLSEIPHVSDTLVKFIAEHCSQLHTLYLAGCTTITDTAIVALAKRCSRLKRIKLSQCSLLTDQAVLALTQECRQLIEIDIAQCNLMTNKAIQAIWDALPQVRDLNATQVPNMTDQAFMSIVPQVNRYEQLRVLNLTSCSLITDQTLHRILPAAPRIRNLVLAKCDRITDYGAGAIKILGKHLHYLHLGHCSKITDRLITSLTQHCTRIRYLDLACCSKLTDASVFALSQLPKLRRIGLVKCSNITDHGIYALLISQVVPQTLERVHLSYCVHLSDTCISALVQQCPKLTHLSLTGVPSFMSRRYHKFCRAPPSEFTAHQREVFCVFSGKGVRELRHFMRENPTLGAATFASIGATLEGIAAGAGSLGVVAAGTAAAVVQGGGAAGGAGAGGDGSDGGSGSTTPTAQTGQVFSFDPLSTPTLATMHAVQGAHSIPVGLMTPPAETSHGMADLNTNLSALDPVGHLAHYGPLLSYVSLNHVPFMTFPPMAHGSMGTAATHEGHHPHTHLHHHHYHHQHPLPHQHQHQHQHHLHHHHHHHLQQHQQLVGGWEVGLETPESVTNVASPASELNAMDEDDSIETEEEDGESPDTQSLPSSSQQRPSS
ncbi:SCF ubiquitin ligase complex subunit [Actinomortierella ambigua]|nr:SCF ubiquitin ligase complex subunit [Actinomortierella ambigua]